MERKLFVMGKADYKKRKLRDPQQDVLLEYKELGGGNRNGKKWYKDYLNRKYRRKDKQFFKRVEDESDEEI
jgi:type III secretory pathway component EscR